MGSTGRGTVTAGEAKVADGAGPSHHTRGLLGCGGENRQLCFQVTAAGGLGCEAGGPGFVLSQEILPTSSPWDKSPGIVHVFL